MFNSIYETANAAFKELYQIINSQRTHVNATRKLYNVSIKILQPDKNNIFTSGRNWSLSYAEREWQWYLSQNRSVATIKKYAPIWDKMHNGNNIVNSNYGFLWNEANQLQNVIEKLRQEPTTRQAFITMYDGKNMGEFTYDTPCTLSIGFVIEDGLLCMTVLMRSNDLWYGFCNDQFCFSKLQCLVAKELKKDVGWYYHYAADMHLYKQHFNKL